MFNWKTHYQWPCSIANCWRNQRVSQVIWVSNKKTSHSRRFHDVGVSVWRTSATTLGRWWFFWHMVGCSWISPSWTAFISKKNEWKLWILKHQKLNLHGSSWIFMDLDGSWWILGHQVHVWIVASLKQPCGELFRDLPWSIQGGAP